MIGDPGGKDSERSFLDDTTLAHNIEAIKIQVGNILKNLKEQTWKELSFEVIDNSQFYTDMSYQKFLRDVGKYITVNQMMAKETVKKRIEDPDKSISYTEFSYMLMQGYDYLRLFKDHGVKLQISGSDQWGNILTGIELIRKKEDGEAYGMTSPLILDSTGKKFGKSEGNAIRLDPDLSTPYFVYQYFMNIADADVERFLKLYTLLDLETISQIVAQHHQKPEARVGQMQLARQVILTLHGTQAADQAEKISELLFGQEDKMELLGKLDRPTILATHKELGGIHLNHQTMSIIDVLVDSGLTTSRGEAKKSIEAWSIYFNEIKVEDIAQTISETDLLDNGVALLRKGKKQYKIVYTHYPRSISKERQVKI